VQLSRSGGPYEFEHNQFRQSVRQFLSKEAAPHFHRWEQEGLIDRAFFLRCGEMGMIGPTVPAADGGLGADFRYNAVIDEEFGYFGLNSGTILQSDIIVDYFVNFGTEDQRKSWLPRLVSGELVAAIAMTEPGTGSDLKAISTTARPQGDGYVVNGSKLYITNGQNCDVVIVAAKTTDGAGSKGLSLILVEATREGFRRGRNLDKIGQWSADTSELFFDDVLVPRANLLGEENGAFSHLMRQLPQERLTIAIMAQAGAQRAFDEAVLFVRERPAFGGTVLDFQNTRFALAGCAADLQVGWAHLDWAISRHVAGELTASEASASKFWHSELQWKITDRALQLHGGAGYMNETAIARLWRDARAQRIYGGTSEIMLEIVGRAL
jgi:alkylation response protein AidB-like acyl-CoA dehydrogenase